MPQYWGRQYQLYTIYFCMQSIPLRKVRSAYDSRDFLGEDRDGYSEQGDRRPAEFGDISKVSLEGLPITIRECLEELSSMDGQNRLNGSSDSPYCQPKHGGDLLRVIQQARQHQQLKIYSCAPDPERSPPRSPKKCKLIRKISRKSSKKIDIEADKISGDILELPSPFKLDAEAPQIRQILEIEDTQPSSVQSLWQEECNNPDYLGIEKLMF